MNQLPNNVPEGFLSRHLETQFHETIHFAMRNNRAPKRHKVGLDQHALKDAEVIA